MMHGIRRSRADNMCSLPALDLAEQSIPDRQRGRPALSSGPCSLAELTAKGDICGAIDGDSWVELCTFSVIPLGAGAVFVLCL